MGSDSCCFVLVHGAWHGGWCWAGVRRSLEAKGHRVFTPTQTGLGERSHLLSRSIDLNVFVQDIVNVLLYERLQDVVLVGHSFGGTSISGTAQQMPDALRHLIYLDALLIKSGETPFSRALPENVQARTAAAETFSEGLAVPPPSAPDFGVTDEKQAAWLESCLTPHPLKTYQSTLDLGQDMTNGVPATYIVCTDPLYDNLATSRGRARSLDWPIEEIATGHDAMVSAPNETADLLMKIAARS